MATSTSINAYRSLDASSQYKAILGLLREGGEWCIADAAKELGFERSTMSARLNELKTFGEIEYAGKKKSRTTGITAMHWRIKSKEPETLSLI